MSVLVVILRPYLCYYYFITPTYLIDVVSCAPNSQPQRRPA